MIEIYDKVISFLSVDVHVPATVSRRALLATAASGLTASLAGCSGVFAETPPRDRPDPFYLENYRNNAHEFTVTITHAHDETDVVTGTYRVPAKHGAVFPTVGDVGTMYHLGVAVDELAPLTRDWNVSICPSEQRGGHANTAGAFFICTDEMGFAQNQCTEQRVGNSTDLTYVPASELKITDDT